MALKVWLPLNKDLRSVGLSKVTVINNGATLDNNGIIGKCYNFSFGNYIGLDAKNVNNHKYSPISIALWVYQTKNYSTRRSVFGCWEDGGGGFYVESQKMGFNLYIGGEYQSCEMPSTLSINTWHHICGTYDEKVMRLYIDGVEVKKISVSGKITYHSTCPWEICGNPRATDFAIGDFEGKFNDIRIYDHCISESDVKRLYQQKLFELIPYSGAKDVLFDRSGLINMPLVNNGAEFNVNYLHFDGTNDQLRPKVTNDGFNISGGTLSIWFSPTEKPNKNRLIYTDEKSHMSIGFSSTGNSLIVRCGTSNGNTNTFSTTGISWGELNNVVVTYNNTMPQICLINGIVPSVYNTSTGFTETTGKGLTIGGRQYNTTSRFDGKIYKVAVYNRQFTQDEAVELYNSERGMFLPDDYIQLEYIEGTGSQWIDSGVKANQDTVVEIEFEITGNATGYGAVFGARTNSSSNSFLAWTKCGNGKIGVQIGNSGSKNCNTSQALNVVYKLKVSNGNITVNGDSANFTPVSDFETPLNVRIFNIANGNTSSSGTGNRILIGKVYSFKLYESDIIIRNMIPSKRKSDNVIGMYDMVSRQFFTNSGSGSFTGA